MSVEEPKTINGLIHGWYDPFYERSERFKEKIRAQRKIEAQVAQTEYGKAVSRQQADVEKENEFHLQRKNQAGAFRQASGIGSLVRALGEIIGKEKFLDHTIYNGPHKKEYFRSRGQSIGPEIGRASCRERV